MYIADVIVDITVMIAVTVAFLCHCCCWLFAVVAVVVAVVAVVAVVGVGGCWRRML